MSCQSTLSNMSNIVKSKNFTNTLNKKQSNYFTKGRSKDTLENIRIYIMCTVDFLNIVNNNISSSR